MHWLSPYSLLDWDPEAHRSWSLPVSVKRIPSQMTAAEMGITQVQQLSENRADLPGVLDIVAADGKFLRPLQGQGCGIVVRIRRDRILYRVPQQPQKRKLGRPSIHGKRFAFKEPETWGTPDEVSTLEHAKLGRVKLERWNNLHGKNDADDVIRASIHLERDKPPQPIRLGWQTPATIANNLLVNVHRWPVETGIRFRKRRLGWTTPQFQHKETGDRWSWLVALALWLLFLSRPIVEDHPLPWQKPQRKLTPQRVQQSLPLIFAQFGSPARTPKMRAKSPGWPKDRHRTPKQRFKVVKKHPEPLYFDCQSTIFST